ncbi:MAG: hypothetical protein KC609_26465 [Myxococcales bacterium]|nr:hypothetical protein [Myxococcales bacterium]
MRSLRHLLVSITLLASPLALAETTPAPTPRKAPAPVHTIKSRQTTPPSPYNFIEYRTRLDALRAEIERFRARISALQARAGATASLRHK